MNNITINLTVNGTKHTLTVAPMMTLLEILREELHLTGTKEGCGKGECGACAVIVNGQTVNSCIFPASQADNAVIETIEGLTVRTGRDRTLHPLQKAFIEEGAVQCGFCTPGMIMSAKALLDKNPNPREEEIKEALDGNLCRCTGYSKIIEAVKSAARRKHD